MKRIFITTALLAGLIATGCKETKPYDATGIFDATIVTVSAEIPGKLLSLSVNEGDTVTTGQLLGVVDTTTLVLQQKQLRHQQAAVESNLPNLTAQAAALRAQIAHAQNEANRIDRLFADNAATQKQRDDAHAQVNTLHGQLEALLSSLGKSSNATRDNALALQYQSEQIAAQIAKSRITSPLSGTVLTKYAQPGEFVGAGKPLYEIANLNEMYLRAYFTCEQLSDMRLGRSVKVIADFGGDQQFEYPGVITWIAQESEFTPKSIQTKSSRANLVYAVKIAVRNDGRLKLGQYGEVRLK